MRKFLSLAAIALLLTGCASVKNTNNVKKRSWNCGVESLDFEGYQKIYLPYVKASMVRYLPEEGNEDNWQTWSETEKLGFGDCEDFAIYLNHLFEQQELRGRLVIGHAVKGETKYMSVFMSGWHVWNEITWRGEDYLIDATWKVFARKKDVSPKYYLEDKYPPSTSRLTSLALKEMGFTWVR